MGTNFKDVAQGTIQNQEPCNNIAVEFSEIKRLLREMDDFVCKLKALEDTLAQRTDDNEQENPTLTRFDDAVLEQRDDQVESVEACVEPPNKQDTIRCLGALQAREPQFQIDRAGFERCQRPTTSKAQHIHAEKAFE